MKADLFGLLAGVTTGAGGAMLNSQTSVSIGLYISGIGAVCTVGIFIGRKLNALETVAKKQEEIFKLLAQQESRLDTVEQHCSAVHGHPLTQTQRLNVEKS